MSELSAQISDALKEAMRSKDTTALTLLRSLKSAIKYAAIEQGGADSELDETATVAVIRKQIKQRQDSLASYEEASREDLAEKERAEITLLERFLPAALSEAEVLALVEQAIADAGATSRKEMGAVMKLLQERSEGRADNKVLSAEVAKRLS